MLFATGFLSDAFLGLVIFGVIINLAIRNIAKSPVTHKVAGSLVEGFIRGFFR
jgi:hypothetical protein